MNIIAPYGITGLTVTVKIIDADADTVVVAAGSMTELTNLAGVYKYNFTGYDNTKDYAWVCDCGSSYEDDIRYIYGVSECDYNKQLADVQTDLDTIEIIEKLTGNNVTKDGDIITIYEDNGVDVWRQYDLSDGGRVLI